MSERTQKKHAARGAVMVVVLCAALGCGFSKDRKAAEELVEQYFAKMQSGDIDGVLALYSARFYKVTSRADWRVFLERQRARCGAPKSHSLITWNVFNAFGTNAGSTTTLMYDVQYASCRLSEKLTTFRPSGGEIQIQGHFLAPTAQTPGDREDARPTLST